MDLHEEIAKVLFKIGQDIKIHKMPDGHLIVDIDYEKYVEEIIYAFDKFIND